MHIVMSIKPFEDLYFNKGGGMEASLFPHARMSLLAVVIIKPED